MRILYIHQYFNTPDMPGSTRSYEFAKRLVANGNTVYMITSNWQNKSSKTFSIENGINVFWSSIKYSNKMGFYRRAFSFIAFILYCLRIGIKLKYDVIIASSTPITVGVPAVILKKFKKTKLIFEVRDVWPQLPIAIGAVKSKIFIKFLKILEKKIYNSSNQIIALSDGMKNEILKIEKNKKKVSVVTNLSDIEKFNVKKEIGIKFRKNSLGIRDEPLILYAGSFGKINNALYLVEIANQSKRLNYNINFLLAGKGYQKNLIENKAKKFGLLGQNLYLVDLVSKNTLPSLLSASTIASSLFIDLPEMENNSANKFFDALAAGKPIMINYKGWQLDLINDFHNGFFIPNNDPKSAIEIINKFIYDRDKIRDMSSNSKKLAKKFSVDKNFSKFEKIVNSCS